MRHKTSQNGLSELHHIILEPVDPALVRVKGPFMPVLLAANVAVHLLGRGIHVHHARVTTRVGLGQAYLQVCVCVIQLQTIEMASDFITP